ncbi:MAG: polysaccharide biosynthesis/export family protein [Candidatus Acidiferrales bacterium]
MQNRILRLLAAFVLMGASISISAAQDKPPKETKSEVSPAGEPSTTDPATPETPPSKDRPALQKRNPRYLVRSSDVLQISFPVTPEFDQLVTVQPDGYISLHGAGDIYVEGKTVPEIIELLKGAYAKILHEPIIDILLKDFEKPYFIVGGQVTRPGKYDLRGDTTVTEAVQIAGGFTEKSKHSKVVIYRRVSEGWMEVKELDVKKMLAKNDLNEDIHLHPGDMIYVPQNGISKIKSFLPSTGLGMSLPY